MSKGTWRLRLAFGLLACVAYGFFIGFLGPAVRPSGAAAKPAHRRLDARERAPTSQLDRDEVAALRSALEGRAAHGLGSPSLSAECGTEVPSKHLLLLSHHHVYRYDPESDRIFLLKSQRRARFRGAVAASAAGEFMWVLSSPLGPEDPPKKDVPDVLQYMHAATGGVIARMTVPNSVDAHDMAAASFDAAWVVDTRHGALLQVRLPRVAASSLQRSFQADVVQTVPLGQRADHLNQVSIVDNKLLVNAHGRGESSVRIIDAENPPKLGRFREPQEDVVRGVGAQAHGLAAWRDCRDGGHAFFVNLDSRDGGLGLLSLETAQYVNVLRQPGKFTKGLAIVDGVAFFGESAAAGALTERLASTVSLVAVDMESAADAFYGAIGAMASDGAGAAARVLWRRELPFEGVLNQILTVHSMPVLRHPVRGAELLPRSRFAAAGRSGPGSYISPGWRVPASKILRKSVKGRTGRAARATAEDGGADGGVGYAQWALRGAPPAMLKREDSPPPSALRMIAYAPGAASEAVGPLPLSEKQVKVLDSADELRAVWRGRGSVDVALLKAHVEALPESAWSEEVQRRENAYLEGRDGFMAKFKAGTSSRVLLFSDTNAEKVVQFPFLNEDMKAMVLPILRQIGVEPENVARLQLAMMPPGSEIKVHVDKGRWVRLAHRVHVPIVTDDDVVFVSRVGGNMMRVPTKEGQAFEINNKSPHAVFNTGGTRRVHLLIDELEGPPAQRSRLGVGESCVYQALSSEPCGDAVRGSFWG